MKQKEFEIMFNDILLECKHILLTKGKEYSGKEDDRGGNFKRIAIKLNLTPLQVWNVYFTKHIDSIDSYVRDGKTYSNESIKGRFVDAINYLFLGYALIKDNEKK